MVHEMNQEVFICWNLHDRHCNDSRSSHILYVWWLNTEEAKRADVDIVMGKSNDLLFQLMFLLLST